MFKETITWVKLRIACSVQKPKKRTLTEKAIEGAWQIR